MDKIKVAKQLVKLAKELIAGNGAGINFTLNKNTKGSIKCTAKLINGKFKCSNLKMDDFKFGTFNAIDNEDYGETKVPFEYVFKLNEIPIEIKDIEALLNENSDQIIEELTEDLIFRKYDADYENYDDARKEI